MEWHVDSVCHAPTNSIIAVILLFSSFVAYVNITSMCTLAGKAFLAQLTYHVRLPC